MDNQEPEGQAPMANTANDDTRSSGTQPDQINRFVILQFGEGPQQDVIIDYRDNIRNAIVEQRQRQQSSSANRNAHPSRSSVENSPAGVRGVDYPAFDVTTEGVFGASRGPNRLLDLFTSNSAGNSAQNSTAEPAAEGSDPTTPAGTNSVNGSNRNIILTVNYEYSSGVDQEDARDRSASLVLNVPNVPQGEDETRLQALIRFATIIAFRTIAMSLQNKNKGISNEQFAKLPVKHLNEIEEKSCPICYDDLIEPKKRKRDDEDASLDEDQTTKSQRASSDVKVETSNSQKQEAVVEVNYSHIPVEMPCKHVFGQDCLHEWLKANNTCPLCRYKIVDANRNSEGVQTTTMNLPNLARFLNDNSRDSLLSGEINRLPMLVVSSDSDPSTAAESLNNDLRNNLNNVPIIVTTSPTTVPVMGGLGSTISSRLPAAPGWNRFTRESIVRRIINSLTGGGAFTSTPTTTQTPTSTSAISSLREQIFQNHERLQRRSESTPNAEFINRDPLFPVGVSSRRTANGVETINITGNNNNNNNNNNNREDYAIQESIVNDLLYGTNRSNNASTSTTAEQTSEQTRSTTSTTEEQTTRDTTNETNTDLANDS